MNDIHGIAPNAPKTLNELRMLLSGFGPFTSRYVLTLPGYKNWHQYLLNHFAHLGEIDQKRLKSILSNARDRQAFIDRTVDFWPITHSWPINALRIWQPHYKPIHVSDEDYLSISKNHPEYIKHIHSPEDIHITSPSDEEIETEPENYWDASKWLCQISAEIHFIDPYLNPQKNKDVSDIFEYYIKQILKLKKPTYIHFWSRIDTGTTNNEIINIENQISKIISNSDTQRNIFFIFHFVDDVKSKDKLHARYLLTEKGGIKFDQGFQRLRPKGRKNIISPIGESLHQILFEKFSKSTNDFPTAKTIQIKNNSQIK